MDRVVALIVNEAHWLPASMGLAVLVVGAVLYRQSRRGMDQRQLTMAAMNLFFAVVIGTMAFGHLLAVTLKLIAGTLEASPLVLYAIGAAVAAPAWWLARHARDLLASDRSPAMKTVALNAWLGATLLALGLHNLPLAVPALFNIGYVGHTRPLLGRAMLALTVVVHAGLLAGALVFLASGQTFEQFSGME